MAVRIKRFKFLCFLIIVIISEYSCQDSKHETLPDNVAAEIIIGDTLNHEMIYEKYVNKYISIESLKRNQNIDVNNDGVDDLQFVTNGFFSMGTAMVFDIDCICLHDAIKLCFVEVVDSIYFTIDSTITINSNLVSILEKRHYTCTKLNKNSVLLKVANRDYLRQFNYNDVLSLNYSFLSDTLQMSNEVGNEPPIFMYHRNDTVQYSQNYKVLFCKNFPWDGEAFAGFKLTINSIDYLGWIKLDFQYGYLLFIEECAIQKPHIFQ